SAQGFANDRLVGGGDDLVAMSTSPIRADKLGIKFGTHPASFFRNFVPRLLRFVVDAIRFGPLLRRTPLMTPLLRRIRFAPVPAPWRVTHRGPSRFYHEGGVTA